MTMRILDICSCFHCNSSSSSSSSSSTIENVCLDTERIHTSKMISHSRFLGSPFSLRSARSFKSFCFIAAIIAFSIGIGIGVLIPLYLLPASTSFESEIYNQRPIVLSSSSSNTPNHNSILQSSDFPVHTNIENGDFGSDLRVPNSVSSRFPEFAEIRALKEGSKSHKEIPYYNTNNKVIRRPSPNVNFVPPASHILSLHPTQHEIPQLNLESPSSSTTTTQQPEKSNRDYIVDNSDLLDGIYWSSKVEQELPQGFTQNEIGSWQRYVKESLVNKIEEGCGRMQNRLLTLGNGTHACCRYRQNSDQIQGEIFSFYLSQLLGLKNLPPSALNLIQTTNEKWSSVRSQLELAQWTNEKPVVLTKFISNLEPANIPVQFRDSKRNLNPSVLLSFSPGSAETNELAQWSDLIVFDYLTANLDRVVNNLYNLQWNPTMMETPAHNLAKDKSTGLLVFLDNESGLLHGYRLLDKYEQYHRIMLDSLCVFRRSTANAIKQFHRDRNIGKSLKKMFYQLEPILVNYLPMLPDKSIKILNHRIGRVYDQIKKCESLYKS